MILLPAGKPAVIHAKRRPRAPGRPGRRSTALLAACLALGGCIDTADLAPASPDTPWQPRTTQGGEGTPAPQPPAQPDMRQSGGAAAPRFALPRDAALPWPDATGLSLASHPYTLDELVDVAQRRNKDTRIAWEQARRAAISVGIAQASYLPQITLDALGGFTRTASPFPTLLVQRGYITSNAEGVFPEVVLKYLLLDFGSRAAAIEEARQLSIAANVGFTAAHQKLILDVTRAYLQLGAADAQLSTAHEALHNARTLQESADAMLSRGEGTVTNAAIARRGVAQAELTLAQAVTAQHTDTLDLLALLELPPQTPLRVQDSTSRPLARGTGRTVDRLMADALRQRPDLLAQLASLRVADAGIAQARAALWPKLSVAANVQGNIGRISTNGEPYESIAQPQAGVFLRLDWPLYTGGVLANQVRLAQSRRAEAQDRLQQEQVQALRQVALAWDLLQTGLVQYDSALALRDAAQVAFNAASGAFAHGVGTLTDATTAQTELARAQSAVVAAHAQSLANAASLAFATGNLSSAQAVGPADAGPDGSAPAPPTPGTMPP